MKKKWFGYLFQISAFLLIAYLLITTAGIYQYSEVDDKRQADVAIVLGAGASDGGVSPVFAERINHAVFLYESGYVDKILITGGYGKGNKYSDAYIGKTYAVSCGVFDADIILEEQSTITQENIENASMIMCDNGYESAIIVSDPLHMKRAMLMAEDYGIVAFASPTPTSRYVTWKTKIPFLLREEFFYVGYRLYRIFL